MGKKLFLLFFAGLLSTSVVAQNWYVDGGVGFIKFDDGVDEISPTNLYIRGGYQLNQYFNLGLESSFTLSPDEMSTPEGDVDFSLTVVTIYIRGGAPVGDNVWLYGQLGHSNSEITAEYHGFELSADDNDIMLGFGAEIDLNSKTTYLALNYSAYNNDGGVDVTAFNIGIGVRF